MYWEEDADSGPPTDKDETVVDVVFRLSARSFPGDYADALFRALMDAPIWLGQNPPSLGVHLATVGEEGNGWYRDASDPASQYLPARSRLHIRLERRHAPTILRLSETELDVDGHALNLTAGAVKALSTITTQYARHVVSNDDDEAAFLAQVRAELQSHGIRCKKMVCGRIRTLTEKGKAITTRSLMLADLSKDDALLLQKVGVGPLRHLGCGFFVPHKSV